MSQTIEPVTLTAAKLADELVDVAQELERPMCLGNIEDLIAGRRIGIWLPKTQAILERQAARLKQLARLLRGN